MKDLFTKKQNLILVLLSLGSMLGSMSCGFYRSKTTQDFDIGQLVRDPKVQVSYAQVNQSILKSSCIGCHNSSQAAGGVALETYTQVAQFAAVIRDDIESGRMPLNRAPLSANQKALFEKWMNQGYPEFPSANPVNPAPTPSTSEVLTAIRASYDSSVKPLIQKACMDCHDANARPTGIIGHLPGSRTIEWKHIHDATAAVDFSRTFPNWSDQSSEPAFFLTSIKNAISDGSMSPKYYRAFHKRDGKILNRDEKKIIFDWIDESMKKLSSVDTTPPSAQKFLAKNCMGCHSPEIHKGGFVLEKNGDEIVVPTGANDDGIPYVTPGSPEKSAIYLVLLQDPAKRGNLAQMPPKGSPVSETNLQQVADWINSIRH